MSNKVQKLHVKPTRIILVFVIAFIVFEGIFYLTMQDFANNGAFPFSIQFYFYTPLLLAISVIFCVVSLTQTYYELDKEKLVHHKMGKTYTYKFKDILYIDEEWSMKHKMVWFYDNNGKDHYLAFDKDGLIYKAMIKNCVIMSWDEYKAKFPNAKM